jgi:hypothetical protein
MPSSGTVRLVRPLPYAAQAFAPTPTPSPGDWVNCWPMVGATSTAGNLNAAQMVMVPMWVPEAMTIDRLAVRHTSTNTVNYRIGLYSATAARVPDRLLFQAEVASAGAAANLESVCRLRLGPGVYYTGAVSQGSTGQLLRATQLHPAGLEATTLSGLLNTANNLWYQTTGTTGELPTTLTRSSLTISAFNDGAVVFWMRRALT